MSESVYHQIENILSNATPIELAQMDGVSLQNRIDRKYILHVSRLPEILKQVMESYYVLEISGHRIFSYKTIYFDTPDFQFFKDHHNGLTNRIKVRCRQYVETNDTFFEIKRKYQGTRTDKYRKHIDGFILDLGNDEYNAIKERYKKRDIDHLKLTLKNFFYRVTLVSKKMNERATIDFDVSFSNGTNEAILSDIAIIEVKQGKMDDSSAIVQVLKKERISAGSISKYSYGMLMTGNNVKYNAFKPLIQKVNKIQSNGIIRHAS